MSGIEDRLRDALRATADMVDERPRPLPARRRPRRERIARVAPLRGWVLPLCAVLAVLALIAGLVGFRELVREPERRLQKVPTMPRFLFASYLGEGGGPSRVEVRDPRTGRLLGSSAAPQGRTYLDLAASGDGRTLFALMREQTAERCGSTIVRFTVSETGRLGGHRPVPGSAVTGIPYDNGSLAVSANGDRLAYTVASCTADVPLGKAAMGNRLVVLDTDSGTRREWLETQNAADGELSLSGSGEWLFFVRSRPVGGSQTRPRTALELRRLPVATAAPGQVTAASRTVRTIAEGRRVTGVAAGPDGHSVMITEGAEAGSTGGEAVSPRVLSHGVEALEVSAGDGRVLRSIRRDGIGPADDEILRSDASGRFVITGSGLFDVDDGRVAIRLPGAVADSYDLEW
ncbi:hypothetical protein AGRA3207_002665 [Actinomadura graeca]|uniref:Uncharacterized protein n=1 Tax=Actinomadura graeca TaxID=2750812 RepID=A0ABX8QSN0_9ACTN|nr:hypothetical protein [Actinomadura graeca]QXJ21778.1 hypothetical protein AGRA3207_002665 [Actinomadura graeca]